MKHIVFILTSFFLIPLFFSCNKEESSSRMELLTAHIWVADSLLVNGEDDSGEGGFLEDFKGDTKFNEDGSGYLGTHVGTWQFASKETQIIITSESLPIPITTKIEELSEVSLKLTTSFIVSVDPPVVYNIRLTYKPK
jgi:hypothetical protein